MSLERVRQEYLPEQRKENRLEVKQVEIQDWSADSGVVSGRVEGEEIGLEDAQTSFGGGLGGHCSVH